MVVEATNTANFLERRITIVNKFLSFGLILIGLFVILGWIFQIEILKSILPSMVAMKANTAICFILIGITFVVYQWMPEKKLRTTIINSSAFVIFFISFLTFFEYLSGYNLGIDQIFFKEAENAILTSSPGRMAFNTSINFALLGIALFFLETKKLIRDLFINILAIPVGILSLFSFIGYIYNANPLIIGLNFSTAMALHTTIGFMIASVLLLTSAKQGLMEIILSQNTGGKVIRRFLPIAILIPFILGGLKIFLTRKGLIDNELSVAMVAIGNIIFVGITIYIMSVYINKEIIKNEKVKKTLEENENRYLAIISEVEEGVFDWNIKSGEIFFSTTYYQILGYKDKEFPANYDSWKNLVHPDDIKSTEHDLQQSIVLGTKFDIDFRMKTKSGEWMHVLLNGKPIEKDEEGKPLRIVGVLTNVSKYINLEDELKKSKDALQLKLDETEKFNKLMIDREMKMIEQKDKIKILEEKISK